jgi:transcriptional regulator with XRE-family HTH domain
MTSEQYRAGCQALGLAAASKAAADMLGISPQTAWRYANGHRAVDSTVARLLIAYQKIKDYGIPLEDALDRKQHPRPE